MISWLRNLVFHLWAPRPYLARVDDLLLPYPEVIEELGRRAADLELRKRVETYLGGAVPDYFQEGSVLYLARHVATPNFETLRFVHLVEALDMKIVIGQDVKDRFVAHNPLKRALGKLPICLSVSQKGGLFSERYQKVTILDFNTANGKPFDGLRTLWGESLIDFHNTLLHTFVNGKVAIEDDSAWIDTMHRGDLLEHYKKFLALFVTHGVLFEDYLVEDKHEGKFVTEVLRPAFAFIEREFGCRPLITKLTPTSPETADYWMSYPKGVLDVVQQNIAKIP